MRGAICASASTPLDLPGHQRAGGRGWWRPPDAIAEFVTLTMARARDQKLVLLLILRLGVGLVFESGVYLSRRVERYGWVVTSGRIEGAALRLPLILAFFAFVGLRRAFRLPVEPAANWLFRLAETPASRTRWLRSTFSTLFCLGAVAPIALCAPAHFALLPAGTAVAVIAWQFLMLAAYANYLMLDWNAVPFAATHNPAQRHFLQVRGLPLRRIRPVRLRWGDYDRCSVAGPPARHRLDRLPGLRCLVAKPPAAERAWPRWA